MFSFMGSVSFQSARSKWRGPAFCPASTSITSAAGCLRELGRFACSHFASVAARSWNAPCPSRDRPCRVVQRQRGETSPHCREVRRLCCDRYLPCRLRRFSSQGAPTGRPRTRSWKSRDGVTFYRKFLSAAAGRGCGRCLSAGIFGQTTAPPVGGLASFYLWNVSFIDQRWKFESSMLVSSPAPSGTDR